MIHQTLMALQPACLTSQIFFYNFFRRWAEFSLFLDASGQNYDLHARMTTPAILIHDWLKKKSSKGKYIIKICTPFQPQPNQVEEVGNNNAQSLGSKIDSYMTGFFTRIAIVSATSPLKTLLVMLTFAIVLCLGITQLR